MEDPPWFIEIILIPTMQLFNSWYAIAFSSEVEQNKPTSAVIHGQRLALWRTSNGDVIATQDRCPHKGASLSSGTVDCDRLICGYHGWRFKADGHCDLIPAQTSTGSLPRRAQLHQLPCQESQGFVWGCLSIGGLWQIPNPSDQGVVLFQSPFEDFFQYLQKVLES